MGLAYRHINLKRLFYYVILGEISTQYAFAVKQRNISVLLRLERFFKHYLFIDTVRILYSRNEMCIENNFHIDLRRCRT